MGDAATSVALNVQPVTFEWLPDQPFKPTFIAQVFD
jgi:hypothetical protein